MGNCIITNDAWIMNLWEVEIKNETTFEVDMSETEFDALKELEKLLRVTEDKSKADRDSIVDSLMYQICSMADKHRSYVRARGDRMTITHKIEEREGQFKKFPDCR